MSNFDKILKKYDYSLPQELIAQKPTSPRDAAKLLIYEKKTDNIFFDKFSNLVKYLPSNAVLVFNNTKVLPARLIVKKETGGIARILYTETKNGLLEFMSDRKLDIKSKLFLNSKTYFIVKKQSEKYYYLKPSFPIKNIFTVLEKYGLTPLPPYIKNSPLSEKEKKNQYQAIFAKIKGSVAAPTASLHFTKKLMDKIKKSGIDTKFITLHVGLGTFAPLTEENIKTGRLHTEFYSIDKKIADFLNKAKKEGRPIIVVGTTTVRTLESLGKNKKLNGSTDLFIKEGYEFKFVDGIITNFHVPKSSLLMLVSAFIKTKKLFEIYQKAINRKFRFFSFGDGMLIK